MASSQGGDLPKKRLFRTYTLGLKEGDVIDSEVVPSSLAAIAPILRVANQIEKQRPRIAYLCRFYAFDKAHQLDPASSGSGVRQFKTTLFHRLERDKESSEAKMTTRNDARELQSFYQQCYERYLKALNDSHTDRAQLEQAYQTTDVLFKVLSALSKSEKVAPEMIEANEAVEEIKDTYAPYNIIPLDVAGCSQEIMQLSEIVLAVQALRNVQGLIWPDVNEDHHKKSGKEDLLDWLQAMFGFQKDNVCNQREHLILLLANIHIKLPSPKTATKIDDCAIDKVLGKLFENYKEWCKFLVRKNSLDLPEDDDSKRQQRKILCLGLYLLIWGEAANIRFMPECLCYIYHHVTTPKRTN